VNTSPVIGAGTGLGLTVRATLRPGRFRRSPGFPPQQATRHPQRPGLHADGVTPRGIHLRVRDSGFPLTEALAAPAKAGRRGLQY